MIIPQTLHILNKHPDHPRSIQCLNLMAPGDQLLLIENGVLLLAAEKLPVANAVFALTADVDARGLGESIGGAKVIDYSEMVALSLHAQQVVSW